MNEINDFLTGYIPTEPETFAYVSLQDVSEHDLMVEVLRRYQQKGHLTLHDRVVIGERVYDPAHYTLTHGGPALGRAK